MAMKNILKKILKQPIRSCMKRRRLSTYVGATACD